VKEKWLDLLLLDLHVPPPPLEPNHPPPTLAPHHPPPPLAPHHLQALDHFVESLFREQSASVQGQEEVRAGIAAELQGLVQRTFQDVTVELFGSSVSGFALVSSNVNLNLNIPGAQEKQVLIPPVMKGVLEILRCNMETYCEVQEDFFAFNKIPRILFMHKARYSHQAMHHSIQYVSSKATPSFRSLFISMFARQLQCKQEGFFRGPVTL